MLNSIDSILKMSTDELTDYLTDTNRGEINDRFRKLVIQNLNLKSTIDYLNGKIEIHKEHDSHIINVCKNIIDVIGE